MKNKLHKIINFALICLLFCTCLVFAEVKAEKFSFSAFAGAKAQTEESDDSSQIEQFAYETPFLVDPIISETDGKEIFIYDSSDKCLKVIDILLGDFREKDATKQINIVPTDIILVQESVILFDNKSGELQALSKTDLSEMEIDGGLISRFLSAKKIVGISIKTNSPSQSTEMQEAGDQNETYIQNDYVLICQNNPIVNNFELIGFEISSNQINIKSSHKFNIASDFGNFSSYEHIYLTQNENKLFFVLFNNDSILSFEYELNLENSSNEVTTIRASIAGEGFEKEKLPDILDVASIELENGKDLLCCKMQDKIEFYELNSNMFTYLSSMDVTGLEEFNSSHMSACKNALVLLSNQKQALKIYVLGNNGEAQEKQKINPEIEDVYFEDKTKIEYYKLKNDCKLTSSPYSKVEILTIEENSTVAIVGYGKFGEKKLEGFV